MIKLYKNSWWLLEKYWFEKLDMTQISNICNVSPQDIHYWMKKFNILRRSYSKARHLSSGNHCNLSSKDIEWIRGELLGDGCLTSYSIYSANFSYCCKFYEYINYIFDTLKSFGIKQAGKIHKTKTDWKKRGFNGKISYGFNGISKAYAELKPIYDKWYPNGKKIVPKDLKLTPLVCRQWYIGDGWLEHRKKRSTQIGIATNGFNISDVDFLIGLLQNIGIKARRCLSDNTIAISANPTQKFLEYIGKCPIKCYKYKWKL